MCSAPILAVVSRAGGPRNSGRGGTKFTKKECLFLTNKAIMLLKTKGRENEQSQTKPIQVALLSFQSSGIQVALGYSSARAGAELQRCAPTGARAEPQTQGSSRQGRDRPPSGEVTQACSADLFLKVCGLSVRAGKKPGTSKTGPRYSLRRAEVALRASTWLQKHSGLHW